MDNVLQLEHNTSETEAKFNLILKQIQDPAVKSSQLVEWLKQCTSAAHLLDKNHKKVVDVLLKVQWMEREPEVIAGFQSFVVSLVAANPVHLRSVIKSLICCFVPILNQKISDTRSDTTIHLVLKTFLNLIPQSSSTITTVFCNSFPYMSKPSKTIVLYVQNLLYVTTYAPHIRSEILEIIVKKLTDIDVHVTREEIEKAEEKYVDEEALFKMDEDAAEEMKHPLANKLDVLMQLLFQYIKEVSFKNENLVAESSKLFWELITCFDKFILPVHELVHVQFIMFYVCSFKQSFFKKFISHCWNKVVDPSIACVIRKSSACYIASLLARASYISLPLVMSWLSEMVAWAHRYMQESLDSVFIDAYCCDISRHYTFYSICQAIFYVLIFRHKKIFEADNGYNYLVSLNLQHLLTSPLNPLKVCLPSIVSLFSSIMRSHQVVYCDTIIERNNRMVLPIAGLSATTSTDFNPLETFFPFDPYVLKRSCAFIETLYIVWESDELDAEGDGKHVDSSMSDWLMTETLNNLSKSLPKSLSTTLDAV